MTLKTTAIRRSDQLMKIFIAFALGLIFAFSESAFAFSEVDMLCNPDKNNCRQFGRKTSNTSPAYPSSGSSFNLNPSSVPTDDAFGIESINYRTEWDFSFVKGNGRIGAGISLSNNEETFFGRPAFEDDVTFLARKKTLSKYISQKNNLATAVTLVNNKKKGFRRFQLNLGVLGIYNKVSKNFSTGGGLSGIFGPFTFGFSTANDEYAFLNNITNKTTDYKYKNVLTSVGLAIGSFALDVSKYTITSDQFTDSLFEVSLITASVSHRKFIFSMGQRSEDSWRDEYDFDTQTLVAKQVKNESFYATQFSATKNLMFGVLYNYYLMREWTATATFLF
jgi:hypothetical protein